MATANQHTTFSVLYMTQDNHCAERLVDITDNPFVVALDLADEGQHNIRVRCITIHPNGTVQTHWAEDYVSPIDEAELMQRQRDHEQAEVTLATIRTCLEDAHLFGWFDRIDTARDILDGYKPASVVA